MLLALGDRFKAFGIAHASLREIGEIGDGSDFSRRSGNGPTIELPPLRAHESGNSRTNREAGLRLPKNPTKWLPPEPAEIIERRREAIRKGPPAGGNPRRTSNPTFS